MNKWGLCLFCAHVGTIEPGEPTEDTVDTAFWTHNSKSEPVGLRPSTLPLGHGGSSQY